MRARLPSFLVLGIAVVLGVPARADTFTFSTGDPDGRIATASRPDSPGKIEIETADDFLLADSTLLDGATFTGLIPTGAPLSSIQNVRVEIYRVFPKDSDSTRLPNVPTRINSPSDNAFTDVDLGGGGLTLTSASILASSFTAANSVVNGIHPSPGSRTGGDGGVTGQEVMFDVGFTAPLNLPADHYFFVPQVQLSNGDFLWLSAPKPIVAPGTPFTPDLQSWIRDANLDPDWLRIGTDIIGGTPAPTFNHTFSLRGRTNANTIPEPATLALLAAAGLTLLGRRRKI